MALTSPLQYAPISASTSGATALVNADTQGRKIRVVSYVVIAAGAVSVKFQSGTTDITGSMNLAANGGVVCASDPDAPVFETLTNSTLNINLGGAVVVGGHVAYFLE